MKKLNEIPIGILLFVVFIVAFDICYFYILINYGPLSKLSVFSMVSIVMWIDILLTTISLFVIPYGFLNGRNWARMFAMIFILWSAFWAICSIIARHRIIWHYLLFVVYVVLIMYLLMSHVKAYFGKNNEIGLSDEEDRVYRYGEYTLYAKDVKLRSGKTQTIYFFSKRRLYSGRPCNKPYNYFVGINKKTGMPYLKKKQ